MGKRRANGEGSISHRKDGKWLVAFPTGLYRDNGKPEKVYKYFNTQAEAVKCLQRLQEEKSRGVDANKGRITASEWIETWIERYKANGLRPTTLSCYRDNFRLHLKTPLSKIQLRELTPYQVQKALDDIGQSSATFQKNYGIINGAMKKAVVLGMILRNPCDEVQFPAKSQKNIRSLTADEQRRFIAALDGRGYRVMFLTYLYTGMRMGEAIPLCWTDIDLENRTLRVEKKVVGYYDRSSRKDLVEVQDFCKTKSSTRTILLTAGLVSILTEYKATMQQKATDDGLPWSEHDLVFRNAHGNMVTAYNLGKWINKVYRRAGIENATLHTLRHTYATRCFEAGVDVKAISEQLGHANTKTTYDTYIHLLHDTKRREIDKLAEIDRFIA